MCLQAPALPVAPGATEAAQAHCELSKGSTKGSDSIELVLAKDCMTPYAWKESLMNITRLQVFTIIFLMMAITERTPWAQSLEVTVQAGSPTCFNLSYTLDTALKNVWYYCASGDQNAYRYPCAREAACNEIIKSFNQACGFNDPVYTYAVWWCQSGCSQGGSRPLGHLPNSWGPTCKAQEWPLATQGVCYR